MIIYYLMIYYNKYIIMDLNEKYFYKMINESNDESNDESNNDEINSDISTDEELIQDTKEFSIYLKKYKYNSQINILSELLLFRNYNLLKTMKYENNYIIKTLIKKINDTCIYIVLTDEQMKYNSLKDLKKNLNTNFNNIILFVSCNGLYIKNKDNSYQFLKVHERVKLLDIFIEKMEYDIKNNHRIDKFKVGQLFYDWTK